MNFLKSSNYPLPLSGYDGFKLSIGFGLFITFFLLFFRPFELDSYSVYQISIFGFITFLVFLIAHNLLPVMIPYVFREESWNILAQIIFYTLLLLVIATLNGFYINYHQNLSFNWGNYWFIIIRTFVLGVIPITIYTLFSHNIKYNKMILHADEYNSRLTGEDSTIKKQIISVTTDLKNEVIQIDTSAFLFAKSSNNYSEIHMLNDKTKLVRLKMSSLIKQLSEAIQIVRCHRSYIVNKDKIVSVNGNAQGLKLTITNSDQIVPVSRKFVNSIKANS